MEKNMFEVYGGNTVCGVTVSGYGLSNGYLDYRSLAEIVGDMILNNTVWSATEPEDWELVSGEDCYGIDINGDECRTAELLKAGTKIEIWGVKS